MQRENRSIGQYQRLSNTLLNFCFFFKTRILKLSPSSRTMLERPSVNILFLSLSHFFLLDSTSCGPTGFITQSPRGRCFSSIRESTHALLSLFTTFIPSNGVIVISYGSNLVNLLPRSPIPLSLPSTWLLHNVHFQDQLAPLFSDR